MDLASFGLSDRRLPVRRGRLSIHYALRETVATLILCPFISSAPTPQNDNRPPIRLSPEEWHSDGARPWRAPALSFPSRGQCRAGNGWTSIWSIHGIYVGAPVELDSTINSMDLELQMDSFSNSMEVGVSMELHEFPWSWSGSRLSQTGLPS